MWGKHSCVGSCRVLIQWGRWLPLWAQSLLHGFLTCSFISVLEGSPSVQHIAHHQGVVTALLTHQGASGGNWLAERASFTWSSFYPLLFLSFIFAQGSSSLPTYPHVSMLWPPPNKESPFPLALFLLPRCQMPSVLRVVCSCCW